jgi:hypothetical protein
MQLHAPGSQHQPGMGQFQYSIPMIFSQLVNGSIKKIKSDAKRELMESGQRKKMEVNNSISQFIAAQQWAFGENMINQSNQQAYNTLYDLLPSCELSPELTMSAVSEVVRRKRDKEKASKKE